LVRKLGWPVRLELVGWLHPHPLPCLPPRRMQPLRPTSAPRPKRKPSQKRVDALAITQAESTARMKASAVGALAVTMASVWLDPCLRLKGGCVRLKDGCVVGWGV
jgi:hypothetical protein